MNASEICSVVDYDPVTGEFTWRERHVDTFKATGVQPVEHKCNAWNKANAGRQAGWIAVNGYRYLNLSGRQVLAHQAAWAVYHGEWPSFPIDHANRVRSDNRIVNLRAASYSLNGANRPVPARSATRIKGVTLHKNGRYRAKITARRVVYNLGYFATAAAAKDAYDAAALRLFGDFAYIAPDQSRAADFIAGEEGK